jgi:hypothetical protein
MASDTATPPAQPGQAAKPACDISNIDAGDTTRLILHVATFLDRNGQPGLGTAFWHRAMPLGDYTRVLQVAREYVEVVA